MAVNASTSPSLSMRPISQRPLGLGCASPAISPVAMQTLISDHVIEYGPWGTSLLWFDAELAPHLLRSSSAAEPVLTRAKWAVGAHALQLHNGQGLEGGDSTDDTRPAIGIEQPRKLLFLGHTERIDQPRMI